MLQQQQRYLALLLNHERYRLFATTLQRFYSLVVITRKMKQHFYE